METFAQRLCRFRRQNAMTQEQLAQKLHVSRQSISSWEQGRTQPDLAMLQQLAELFHISLDELIQGLKANEYEPPYRMFRILCGCNVLGTLLQFAAAWIARIAWGAWLVGAISYLAFYLLLYLPFSYFMRHHDYSLLAGYDEDCPYQEEEVQKQLSRMLFLTGVTSLLYEGISAVLLLCRASLLSLPVLFYAISITVILVSVSYAGRARILQRERDRRLAYSGWKAEGLFLSAILLLGLDVWMIYALLGVENNTPQALALFVLLLPYLVGNGIWLIAVETKIKRQKQAGLFYRLSIRDWVIWGSDMVYLAFLFGVIAWSA